MWQEHWTWIGRVWRTAIVLPIWSTSFTPPELKKAYKRLFNIHSTQIILVHLPRFTGLPTLPTLPHDPNMTQTWPTQMKYTIQTDADSVGPMVLPSFPGSDHWLEVWFGPSKSRGNSRFNGDGRSHLAMKFIGGDFSGVVWICWAPRRLSENLKAVCCFVHIYIAVKMNQ